MSQPMLPVTFDRDTGRFFAAAHEGKLVYRACNACGHGLAVPTQFCGACGSEDTGWRESRGTGTLFTWTTVAHSVHPAYPAPYTIVVVALDDAPSVRLVGSLPGAPGLRAGQAMRVVFQRMTDDITVPQWVTA